MTASVSHAVKEARTRVAPMAVDLAKRLPALMQEVVAFSMEHVHQGGIPFAAFVVDGGGTVLGRGVNRVCECRDPTAHAEVQAIRDACRAHGIGRLHGATLLASGEPCAMCYMSALYSGITQICFAVDRDEAAANGFDYRGSYTVLASDPIDWHSPVVRKLPVPEGLQPFLAFRARSASA